MELFILWMGPIAAICIGIMVLAVFFKALSSLSERVLDVKVVKIKKIFKQSETVDVHLSCGKQVPAVRFVGVAAQDSYRGIYPMIMFEKGDGRRVLVRADAIRVMEEQPSSAG